MRSSADYQFRDLGRDRCYQPLPTMPVPALDHRYIASAVKPVGDGFKPLLHLEPIAASNPCRSEQHLYRQGVS